MSRALTPRQQRFIELYADNSDAAASYRGAGYSAKSDAAAGSGGSQLLSRPFIRDALNDLLRSRVHIEHYNREWVRCQMRKLYEKCLAEDDNSNARALLDMMNRTEQQYVERHEIKAAGIVFNIKR